MLKPNDRVAGFTVLSRVELPEYRGVGLLCKHDKMGAEVFHVQSDDEENVFAFAFKSPPPDSTGVAHILEHSVLCGSKAYPLKDAFLVLAKGSLNTFLNAFTFPDKTVYPAASVVEADYFNLMAVYGDAVFFPLLSRETFLQEGHRLEVGEDGKLSIQGVVYNEMRGNYSSADGIAGDWSFRSIFKGTPYEEDSGGDPEHIPELTYEAFKEFHKRCYSPANCKLFLYGNISTERQLEFLNERFFSRLEPGVPGPEAPLVPRFEKPIRLEVPFPAQEGGQDRSIVLLNWLACEIVDPVETLAMEVLSEALLGNDGSPLARALNESGLGDDLAAQSGLETELRELSFSVGLRGCAKEKADEIEAFVLKTLEAIVRDGIPAGALDAAIRGIEFANREIKRGSGPYGLRLMRKSLRGWLHGASPETTLVFVESMQALRARYTSDSRYFEKLLESSLLRNQHRSTLVAYPDPSLASRQEAALRERLDAIEKGLDAKARAELKAQAEKLARAQEEPDSPEALASIPLVKSADIPKKVEHISSFRQDIGEVSTLCHDLFTNGIEYVDLAFSLDKLPEAFLRYIPIFSRAIIDMGLPGRPYHEIAEALARLTGGFNCLHHVATAPSGPKGLLIFRLKYLRELELEALPLAFQLIANADFSDSERLADLVTELKNDFLSSIVPSGNSYAQLRSARTLSSSLAIDEEWSGLRQLEFIVALAESMGKPESAEAASREIASVLDAIRSFILTRSRLELNLTATASDLRGTMKSLEGLLGTLPLSSTLPETLPRFDPDIASGPEGWELSSGVAYAATSFPSSPLRSREFAHEQILCHQLSTGFLWQEIRMKGGAYGAWASPDGIEGITCFSSYRDPKPAESLERFELALEDAYKNPLDEDSLDKSIVGSVARDLKPMAPEERGFVDFKRKLYSIEDDMRQAKRDALLSCTQEDIVNAARRLRASMEGGIPCVIGDHAALERLKTLIPGIRIGKLPV